MPIEDFIIKNSPGKGKGLFSTKDFPKNQILIKFEGVKLYKESIPDFTGPIAACMLQIGPELYLDLQNNSSFFINHSCNPNCFIRISSGTAFLLSYLPIKAGDELTFDYSTSSTEDAITWSMPCNCSLFHCRKIITGFGSLPKEKQREYIAQGIVPKYVQQK